MSEGFEIERNGRVLIYRFSRLEKKNAITRAMYEGLNNAFDEVTASETLRVLMITGTDDVFTAGNDIKDFLENPPMDGSSPVLKFLNALPAFEKPLIIAVNGVAVGVGVTMLLHADLAFASEGARFRMPFVDLALTPEAGSTYLLPRMLGRPKAAELLLLASEFDASEAEALGLINRVLPESELFDHALDVAKALAEKPPEAVRLTKKLMRGHQEPLLAAMEEEERTISDRIRSVEAREVFQAFLEKRPPNFD